MQSISCTNCKESNLINARYCNKCGYELPIVNTETSENADEPIKKSNLDRKKKLIGMAVGLIVSSISYWAVQELFFSAPSFDKVMMQVASELNKTCPIMVDEYTQLDNAVALPNNTFQYNYTLVYLTKEEVNLDTVKKYIEPLILNNIRTNPDMKYFREKKATIVYSYKDKLGVFVHKYAVTPAMYQ